ncbi:uncharacterized protein LOC124497453 [Dermatophagoides farinae]|uniref:uncharacterized protein LOC124497453 n=1 Tax=Dermatophagoides farinae TaxID=6954 RepID=UPI003F6194BE
MNSNQKSISKHRTGGGGGGGSGQSQGNQRGDYQRSNQDRYQSHAIRSNNSNVTQACINAVAINPAAAMNQTQLIRNYNTNQQTQPALIGHQPASIQMAHLNPQQQQQQQQPTGGGGGGGVPTVVSSQQAMSGMINAAAVAAVAQQRFQTFTAQAPQQQQQRIPTNHQNSIRPSYNHPMRAGSGGGGNNAGNIPNHHHNNIQSYAAIPATAAAATIPNYVSYAPNQSYGYHHHPHHHHPGTFHPNQFSIQNPVHHQQMTYGYHHQPMFFLPDYARFPYQLPANMQTNAAAAAADLNNQQSAGTSYKPNDVQHHQQQQQPQQQQQQPGTTGQQPQSQHQQPQISMPIQPQPIKHQREKKPLEIYDDNGVRIDLSQLASLAKNKPTTNITLSNNNDNIPNVENQSKTEKNVENTTRIKTEFNGPVKNDGTKLQNTDDKTIDKSNNGSIDVNDESKSDDNSVSSAVNDKPNESQQQQTTPITSSESSSADGHPKLSCDMNNEMTIPTTTSTADLSPSSISNSDPKQSKINDDGQIIDEITAKVDKLAMNNNDDNSTTSTIDGDFVKVTGDGDTVVVDANAAASVIDGADDGKESLEMNSTTLRDENKKSSTVAHLTKGEESISIQQTSTTTTGDMESSFEIIDHITSDLSIPTTTTKTVTAAAGAAAVDLVNHDRDSRNATPEPPSNVVESPSKLRQKPATTFGIGGNNDNVVAAVENTANNNSIVIDSRQYSRDALLKLRSNATELDLTHSNQENVHDIIRKTSPNIQTDSLLPLYARQNRPMNDNTLQFRNKSMVQPSRRPSQPSRHYSEQKSRKIFSTSLYSDYPHNSDEWRPGKIQSEDPNEIETGNLLKTVRSILNKLTPENYKTLLVQFKALKIDTKNRLVRVIDLIFDKAVAEPAFVEQYAGFCSELIHIKVNEENENNEMVQVKFKNLLISKCQHTFFEAMYSHITDLIQEVKSTENQEKLKQLEEQLEEEKMLARKRSVGNIKLISELFKLNMLNASIMFACFTYLLKNFVEYNHEEYIECLCALITNIGRTLTDQIRMKFQDHIPKFDTLFNQLEKIYNEESETKVSPRIRFMILDLLELRKNKWIPRRKKEGPKLISQVHADMEMQQRMKNESANEMKKRQKQQQHQQHYQHQNNAQNNDEWQQVNKRKSQHMNAPMKSFNFSVLKNITSSSASKNESGSSSGFSMFTSGSHGGSNSGSQSRSSSTNYDNKNFGSSNDKNQRTFHDSLNAKNYPQRGRDERKVSDVTNYRQMDKHHRSDSQQSLKSSSSITANLSPTPRSDSMDNLRSSSAASAVPVLNPMEFQERISDALKEYLKKQDFEEFYKDVQSFCSKTKCADFISESIVLSLDKTSQEYNPRERFGQFLGQFFCSSFCECSDIFESLKAVFAQYEDLKIDLPKFFQFVAEVIAYATLIVYEKGSSAATKNDIMKAVVKAYNEISGSESALFRDSLLKSIEQKNKKCFEEIRPYFHSTQQAELDKYDKLDDIIDQYMVTADLDQLKSQIKENFSQNETDEDFKCALYYKLLYACFKTHNATSTKWDRIKNLIESFVNDKNDEILFLIKCTALFEELNQPQQLLPEIFIYLRDNKLIQNESFYQWKVHRKTKAIAFMTVKRFIENLDKK